MVSYPPHAELEQLLVAVGGDVHPVVAVGEPAVRPVELVHVDRETQHVAAAPDRAVVGRDELAVSRARRDVLAVEDDIESRAVGREPIGAGVLDQERDVLLAAGVVHPAFASEIIVTSVRSCSVASSPASSTAALTRSTPVVIVPTTPAAITRLAMNRMRCETGTLAIYALTSAVSRTPDSTTRTTRVSPATTSVEIVLVDLDSQRLAAEPQLGVAVAVDGRGRVCPAHVDVLVVDEQRRIAGDEPDRAVVGGVDSEVAGRVVVRRVRNREVRVLSFERALVYPVLCVADAVEAVGRDG